MSHYDEYIDANETTEQFPGVGVCEFIIQGLTSGMVKIQYLIPKTPTIPSPTWADYPGLAFVSDTYRKVYLSEEGVYFRAVGVGNNNDVYIRFRTLNMGVQLVYNVPDPSADDLAVGHGYTPGITGTFPVFTNNLDGTIDVPPSQCILKMTPDFTGQLVLFNIPGVTDLLLLDNAENFLVVNYNAGTPEYQITQDLSNITFSDIVPVSTIYREGPVLHELTWGSTGDGLCTKLLQRFIRTHRFEREEYDGLLLSEYGTRNLQVTEGQVWYGATKATTPTSLSHLHGLYHWYHSAGMWVDSVVYAYPNDQCDNGTDLITLDNSKYTVAWIFTGVDEGDNHTYMVLGNQYANLAEVEAAQVPPLPDIIRRHAILVGRVLIFKGQATAVRVESAFSGTFQQTTISTDGVVIRQKIISGTTGVAQGNSVTLAHLLDSTKIIHLSGTVEYNTGYKVPQEHSGTAGYQFSLALDPTNVTVKNSSANSSNILSKPFKVTITYTE